MPEQDPLWARGNPSGFAAGKIDTWMLSSRAVTRGSCKSESKSKQGSQQGFQSGHFSIGVEEVGGKVTENLPPCCLVPCQSAEHTINMMIYVEESLLTCKDELEV